MHNAVWAAALTLLMLCVAGALYWRRSSLRRALDASFPPDFGEARFRLIFEQAPLGIALMDPVSGRIIEANSRLASIVGRDPVELSTLDWQRLTHPEDIPQQLANMARLNAGEITDFRSSKRYLRPDGTVVWANLIYTQMRGERVEDSYTLAIVEDITEQRQIQEQLRISEARHRLLADNALDVIWTMGLDGSITYVSPAVEKLRGFTPEEAMRQPVEEILTPESAAIVLDYFGRLHAALQAGRPPERFRGELEYYHKDGSTIWTEVVALPLLAPDGTCIEILGMSRDISALKAAENQAKAGEQRMRRILDNIPTPIGVVRLDPEARLIFINEQAKRTLGYTLDDIPTVEAWARLAYPDEAYRVAIMARWDTAVAEAIRAGGKIDFGEVRIVCKDGGKRDMLLSAMLMDEMLLISLVDITARKQVEDQLRISQERYRLMSAYALDNLWTMDPSYRLTYISRSIQALTGYTPDEYLRMTLERQLAPGSLAVAGVYFARVAECLAAGLPAEHFRGEIELNCKDGSTLWTEIIVTPVLDDQGRLLEFAGVTRDIRERKRFELELHQARAAAESANAAKSEFLAHMSHEIRTPLNVVLGLTQVLDREPLAVHQRDMVERIQVAGQSLLAIINDVLDLSKIEAGQLRIEARPFDLLKLMSRLESLLGPSAQTKGLALRIAMPDPALGTLVGDALRLEQVLMNLIGNAIKFTEQGEVGLDVQVLESSESAVRLHLAVRDTGIGIAPEALPGLFTPFTQAESGITRRFGGTGLGLSISKRLVELMGGTIGVESQPGQGSTFWIELSFARALDAALDSWNAEPATHAPSTPSIPAGPRLAGAHLLVVDDSAMNRDLVARALALEGATATLAADGQQAVQILKSRPERFDAVLMDVRMPVMDGLTATRVIRGKLGLGELPILALTAGVLPEEQAAAYAAGVSEILPKPLDLEQLATSLSRLIGRRSETVGLTAAVMSVAQPIPTAETARLAGDPNALPAIAGIEPDRVAQPLRQDQAFFLRLLATFMVECAGLVEEVRRDLEAGEPAGAIGRLHRLRGNAGNLGAWAIMALAARLEAAIQDGASRAELGDDLDSLEHQLAALGAASAQWRPPADPLDQQAGLELAPTGALDPDQLQRLREALASNNARARQLFKILEPAFRSLLGDEATATIGRAIRDLRFDEALVALGRRFPGAGSDR